MKKFVEMELHDVAEGTKLALDVTDERGNCLIPAGSELTQTVLDRLGKRGIKTLSVIEKVDLSQEEQETMQQVVQGRMDSLFQNVE